jgi:hypothetical protein
MQAFALGFTENDKDLVAFSGMKSKIYEIVLSTGQRTAIGTAPAATNPACPRQSQFKGDHPERVRGPSQAKPRIR